MFAFRETKRLRRKFLRWVPDLKIHSASLRSSPSGKAVEGVAEVASHPLPLSRTSGAKRNADPRSRREAAAKAAHLTHDLVDEEQHGRDARADGDRGQHGADVLPSRLVAVVSGHIHGRAPVERSILIASTFGIVEPIHLGRGFFQPVYRAPYPRRAP